MHFAFMREHTEEFSIESMCRVFGVSASGYHASCSRPQCARAKEDHALADQVQEIFEEHKGRYGLPRIYRRLRELGRNVSRKRVRKTMRMRGLRASTPRKRVLTTDSGHSEPIAPNVLKQDFTASAPDQKWAGDITYIATGEGWLYLAVFLDLFSRKVIGWSMSENIDRHLTISALMMALQARRPSGPLIVHSDQGRQYAAGEFRKLIADWSITPSMSRRGNCYDNAVSESFFATLKKELVHRNRYRARDEARASIFEYIESYYNRQRMNTTLDYVSPTAFELAWSAQETEEPMNVVNPCEAEGFSMVIGGSTSSERSDSFSTNLCPL